MAMSMGEAQRFVELEQRVRELEERLAQMEPPQPRKLGRPPKAPPVEEVQA